MEDTNQEPIILNMETYSNKNTIINTLDTTPEEIKQVKKPRGRPTKTEQETTKPKKAKEQKKENNIYEEQQQILNIQSKLNSLKEADQAHSKALNELKEAEQEHSKALNRVKEAEQEYNKELKQFKPKVRTTATPKLTTNKEAEQ